MPLFTLSLYLLHGLYFRYSQNKDKETNDTRGILPCLLQKIFMESPIPLHKSKKCSSWYFFNVLWNLPSLPTSAEEVPAMLTQ